MEKKKLNEYYYLITEKKTFFSDVR